jgi:hypothetical protein
MVDITRHLWLGHQQCYSGDPGIKPTYSTNIFLKYSTLFIYRVIEKSVCN